MPLITANQFRELFEVSDDIGDPRLVRYIGQGARRLREWVGAASYNAAAAITVGENTPAADRDLRESLELAEGHLAMHFGLRNYNTTLTPGGVVKTAKVEGNAVLSYLTPSETRELEADYLGQAEEIARAYLVHDGTPDTPFAVVESDG